MNIYEVVCVTGVGVGGLRCGLVQDGRDALYDEREPFPATSFLRAAAAAAILLIAANRRRRLPARGVSQASQES
jgi:hypothetical protein